MADARDVGMNRKAFQVPAQEAPCEADPVYVRLDAARLAVGTIVSVLGWPGVYTLVEVNARGWWFVPVDQPDMRPTPASSGAAKVMLLAVAGAPPQYAPLPTAPASQPVHKPSAAIAPATISAPTPQRGKRGRPRKEGPVSRWTERRRAGLPS